MEKNSFYNLFLDLLRECFDCENQLITVLPVIINKTTNQELKKGLSHHLEETKEQLQRLKSIFKSLNETPGVKIAYLLKP